MGNLLQKEKKSEIDCIRMFQVPLFLIQCEKWRSKKTKLLTLFSNLSLNDFHSKNLKTDFHNGICASQDQDLEKIFSKELDLLKKELCVPNLKISRSWFEKTEQGGSHGIHNHGATGYSAVCFVEYDSKEHTGTRFVSPFNNFLTGNALTFHTIVEEGTLIFFPSVILHYTETNFSKKPRLIVSFNLQICN